MPLVTNGTGMVNEPFAVSVTNPKEINRYYYKLINEEFRNLQLDQNLRNKSIFDLIDYCESLYEKLSELVTANDDSLRYYIKGYLIFNYFINSFIMVHFKGFDQFILTNEYDFIIYLNVFAFYNTDEIVKSNSYVLPLSDLRKLVLNYLADKNLLKFNVKELYSWLYEYIDYLKKKDHYSASNSQAVLEEEPDEDLFDDYYHEHDSKQLPSVPKSEKHYDLASDFNTMTMDSRENDPLNDFINRFPSVKMENDSKTKPKKKPPPLPTEPPPGLPLENRKQTTKNINTSPSSTPYPVQNNTFNNFEEIPYPLKPDSEIYLSGNYKSVDNIPQSTSHYNRPPAKPMDQSQSHPIIPQVNYSNPVLYSMPSSQMDYQYNNYPMYPQPEFQPNNYTSYQNYSMTSDQYYGGPQQMYPGASVPTQPVYMAPSQNAPLPPVPPVSTQPNTYNIPANQPHNYSSQDSIRMHKQNQMKQLSICGLKNFSSSCYINSTIQLLFGIEQFKHIFSNLHYNKFIRNPKFIAARKNPDNNSRDSILLSEAVSGLLKSFTMHGGASIAPTKFIRLSSILKPDFNIPHEQQDSQEFLLFILERLHEELSNKGIENSDITMYNFEKFMSIWKISIPDKEKEEYFKWYKSLVQYEGTSPVNDLFEGHLQNKLICDKCGYESINYSPFTILSLPIPSKQQGQTVDLSECLRYYTQDEILSGDNAWNCPKCFKIDKNEPNALDNHPVFVNKRSGIFKLSRRSKSPTKEKQKVKQNNSNKISISTKRLIFVKLPKIMFIHLSRFSMFNMTDKLNTVIAYPLKLKFNSNNDLKITYKLSGIINHYGNLKSGHYTSLINKSNVNGSNGWDNLSSPYWCYFDDENIRADVAHGDLYNETQSSKLQSRDVYVLCYERV